MNHRTQSVGIVSGWTCTAKQLETFARIAADLKADGYDSGFPVGSTGHDGEGNVYVDLHAMDARIAPVTVRIDPDGFTWDL